MTNVTVWDYINFFMSPLVHFLATVIYLLLFQDIPFFHHIVPINNIDPAVFHFHRQLLCAYFLEWYNVWMRSKHSVLKFLNTEPIRPQYLHHMHECHWCLRLWGFIFPWNVNIFLLFLNVQKCFEALELMYTSNG